YDFTYEKKTEEYMMASIYRKDFNSVSKERLKNEIFICLQEKKSYKIISEFAKLNIVKEFFFIEKLSKKKIGWLQEFDDNSEVVDKIFIKLLIIFFNSNKFAIRRFCQNYQISKDKETELLN